MKYWRRISTSVDNAFIAISPSGHSTELSRTSTSSSVAVDNDKNATQPHRIVVTRTIYKVTKSGLLKKLLGQEVMSIGDGPVSWPEYTHRKQVRWQAIIQKYRHKNSLLTHYTYSQTGITLMPENQVSRALVDQCHDILMTTTNAR